MFNYESEELYQMVRGETKPSSPVYMADCKEEILTEVTPNYPKLTEYEKEWMSFAKNIYKAGTPIPLEYLEVQTADQATVENVIPFVYKSASLNGNTKYRDIDTGDILDTFDETKNLELVSVKLPVLTTTGKNLFDGEWEQGSIDQATGELITSTNYRCKNKIPVVPLSQIVSNTNLNLLFYDKNDLFVGYKFQSEGMTMQVPSGAVYLRFYQSAKVDGLQVESNTVTTTYEPYQSNILTVNEDIELRGIGDVKDELNLLTGELTQRVEEIVLDGSEAWFYGAGNSNETLALFYLKLDDNKIYKQSINDKLPSIGGYGVKFGEGIYVDGDINIRVDCKKLNETSINNFKKWLSNNPITLQYKLGQPIIKTVDLSRPIKPYEGTNNYTVSSDTIPPQLLLLVPIESTGKQTLNDINTEE